MLTSKNGISDRLRQGGASQNQVCSGRLHEVELTRTRTGLARTQRMLQDLARHGADSVGFRDRIPYVLDLMAGVTRTIDAESHGHRTAAFSAWWTNLDRAEQRAITDIRNAELKELDTRTSMRQRTTTNADPVDFSDLTVNPGDTVTRIFWTFDGGPLHDAPVLEA
ncbi:hypothetical protein ACIA5C_20205 [Actinoplanes sp. NPDC051343]|uniref:hypothetical protein n=1 Tax=Actinoplanes sp. NPDC051343 TaxID=3363906 RepID=UPI0037896BAF